ncbi:tRNA uridine(34) 5-carboxymethylaminomethyl modification radical SAM/GNAT enzyme Elp3 [Patescibacteria group bacterium]|nr:tRNA uridine(34) 5-carboxymethylaminomethyl modification radical SAM/GNAT enzyme Elp3 [Patescibacteria group bacterium]
MAIRRLRRDTVSFSELKKNICFELKIPMPPTNADLREHYEKLVARKIVKRSPQLEKILLSRKIRTQSGVAVVAVLTKSYPCPGQCLYCPTEKDMPKSYLSNEPAVMRAISAQFNPYRQVQGRLRSLELNGHQTDKIELIVMGGTFSALPKNYQQKFIAECFRACNEYPNHKTWNMEHGTISNLLREQRRNERVKHRIIGLTLETRPDFIDEAEIINFRNLGCTRVELGVQSIFNDVLEINKRGHKIEASIEASKLLKDAGFKINYHMMPGLPGSNPRKDFLMFQKLFSDPAFQPDMLKIYPTAVTKNSALYKLWRQGKYHPLTDEHFKKLILKIKKEAIPPYVRISRLVRDVPATSIVAGPKISNLRQLIAPQSLCQCIRCREVRGNYDLKEKIILDRIDYFASDGKEIFLQYTSKNKKKLFALLRLRILSNNNHFIPALRQAALIREVHTYGQLTQINKYSKKSPQHFGLGKKLMAEAEKIAKKEFGLNYMAVISGIGARNYYRKIGYTLKNTYMVKGL